MMLIKRVTAIAVIVVFPVVMGCSSASPTTKAHVEPVPLIRVDYFFRSSQPGATTNPATVPTTNPEPSSEPSVVPTVHVTFLGLENQPSTQFEPVGSQAVSFSSTGGSSVVLPAAELLRNATITHLKFAASLPALLRKANSGTITPIGHLNGVLPAAISATFSVADPKNFVDPINGTSFHRGIDISLSAGTPTQLTLAMNDFSAWRDGGFGKRTEQAIFNLTDPQLQSIALVVPFQFSNLPIKAVAVLIQFESDPGDTSPQIKIATSQALQHRSTTESASSTGAPASSSTIQTALDSLAPLKSRRASLVFLANQTNATLCEDVALEADDATLAKLVESIRGKLNSGLDVGWLLDKSTLELLAKTISDAANGGHKAPAELEAILTTHTGEVGRHSSSIDELLKGLSSEKEFTARLTTQNLIFLEDSSPSARVRAFDWLSVRHLAPAGYDPLAPGKQRREALEKAATQP